MNRKRGTDLLNNPSIATSVGTFGKQKIPKIIHQTWKTEKLKDYQADSKQTVEKNHPDFLHVLWTDVDNIELITTRFPDDMAMYKGFKKNIMRADFARLLFLYEFGGIYLDLDVKANKNLAENLPTDDGDFYVIESEHKITEFTQNAIMIAKAKSEIVMVNIQTVRDIAKYMRESPMGIPTLIRNDPLIGPIVLYWSIPLVTGPGAPGRQCGNAGPTVTGQRNTSHA